MDFRLTIVICCLIIVAMVSAHPASDDVEELRHKRDVMESMKNAWNEVVRTLSDAGDAVVHVFKPTEKSVITKVQESVKGITK